MMPAPAQQFWTGPYEYALPSDLIAQYPSNRRDESRLMVVNRTRETLTSTTFAHLPELLDTGDLLVANDSRVVPARIDARKPTGGAVELLLVPPFSGSRAWALAKTSKPLRRGSALELADSTRVTVADAPGEGRYLLDFGGRSALDAAQALGRVPLPPYIRGGREEAGDRERYQTIYAHEPGSVAAPTAGLHFTPQVMSALTRREVGFATLTLHVGPGTFAPLRGEPDAHQMEAETFRVDGALAARIEQVKDAGKRLVAVGTTSVRALESAADPSHPGRVRVSESSTRLFIRPGFRFLVCDALLTNFHLPHSTLLCLVMAFAGDALVRRAYEQAVRERYRFYSYGDAMLIL